MPAQHGILEKLRKRKSPNGTIMAVSMMKDEAPYLLEWYAHHLAVGFTDILVYTNDCSDGTVEMLQRLEELGLGYHRHNVIPDGVKPQPSALKHAQAEPLVQAADWLLVFDADEFLCINHPSGNLDGLISDAVEKGANGIVITWRIFGSGGVVDWSRKPVTEQYLRAAPPLWNKGWGVKTLFKFDPEYWKLGIHRPSIKNKHLETGFPESVKWLNGSGLPMEDYFKFRGWRSIRRTLGYEWAQMNHYAVKSVDAYAVRKFRGNVNNKKDKYNSDYWALQDRNEVEDRSILRHAPLGREIMQALLMDPVLRALHEAALDRIETRLDAYKQTPEYQGLKNELIEAGKTPIAKVVAKPPQPRDPAKIAAMMSRVERTATEKFEKPREANTDFQTVASPYVGQDARLSTAASTQWFLNHDIELPADPGLFSSEALNSIVAGRFDRRNARNIGGYLDGCARLLEIGSGVGFVPLKASRDLPKLIIMAQDCRSGLVRAAREIARRNGLENSSRLKFSDGFLSFEADRQGQASGLAAYLTDFRPDVLRLAAPDHLPSELLRTASLSCVGRVIIPYAGEQARDLSRQEYGPVLADLGLTESMDRAESGSLQFDREPQI